MSRSAPVHREVSCYHCREALRVPVRAITLTCPECHRLIHVADVVVEREHRSHAVRTCGVVVVGPRGKLLASTVEASGGIHVLGRLEGDVTTAGPVVIGRQAVWQGDCAAASIVIQPGATILGGRFTIRGAEPSPALV